jgi:hypothetical protein
MAASGASGLPLMRKKKTLDSFGTDDKPYPVQNYHLIALVTTGKATVKGGGYER